jgi:hypothetical protein
MNDELERIRKETIVAWSSYELVEVYPQPHVFIRQYLTAGTSSPAVIIIVRVVYYEELLERKVAAPV